MPCRGRTVLFRAVIVLELRRAGDLQDRRAIEEIRRGHRLTLLLLDCGGDSIRGFDIRNGGVGCRQGSRDKQSDHFTILAVRR
jgi:hypothetical protein